MTGFIELYSKNKEQKYNNNNNYIMFTFCYIENKKYNGFDYI